MNGARTLLNFSIAYRCILAQNPGTEGFMIINFISSEMIEILIIIYDRIIYLVAETEHF